MKICKDAKELRSLHNGEDLMCVAVVKEGREKQVYITAYTEDLGDHVEICTPSDFNLQPFFNNEVKNIWDIAAVCKQYWSSLNQDDPYKNALDEFESVDGYLLLKDYEELKNLLVFDEGAYWVSVSSKVDEDAFENHLCAQCDVIHNAVYNMVCEITGKEMEWDMAYIGELSDVIADTLKGLRLPVCYPAYLDSENRYRCCDEDECPYGCVECPLKPEADSSDDRVVHRDNDDLEDGSNDDADNEHEDTPDLHPAYEYLVRLGDSAEFNFSIYNDAVKFYKAYKEIMKDAENAPSCVLYHYDKATDSYAQILVKED